IAPVSCFQMRAAAFVQLRSIGLDPAPDATGIHLDAALGQELRDVLVRQWIPQIPTDAQQDHLARKMAPFEGIGPSDRHQISPLPDEPPVFRKGTGPPAYPPSWALSAVSASLLRFNARCFTGLASISSDTALTRKVPGDRVRGVH